MFMRKRLGGLELSCIKARYLTQVFNCSTLNMDKTKELTDM